MQANILPFYTPSVEGKTFFSEEDHVAYKIKRKEV